MAKDQPRKKVRTGCITCKYVTHPPTHPPYSQIHHLSESDVVGRCRIRRIKCDEAKPNCVRCTSTGRKCDGYLPVSSSSPDASLVRIPIPPGTRNCQAQGPKLIHNISLTFPGTAKERRAFDFFSKATAPELCGYFPEQFWSRDVLQASFSQPALRHAAIAIGALHESFSTANLPPESGPPNQFALRQYTKAISNLTTQLSSPQRDINVAIMACILFICFDSLLGSFDAAITHLRSGVNIMTNEKCVDVEVYHRIFTRLGLQALMFIDDSSIEKRIHWKPPGLDPCHHYTTFATLDEARNAFNSIIYDLMHLIYTISDGEKGVYPKPTEIEIMRDANAFAESQLAEARSARLPVSPEAEVKLVAYAQSLENWNNAFTEFMNRSSHILKGKELRGATLLKIHHLTSSILLAATLLKTEPDLADCNPAFEHVISLTASLVKSEAGGQRPSFTSDLGIIGPLYYIGLNTRSRSVKQRVLELLRVPRREGMWDSRIAAFVIDKVIKLEDDGITFAEGYGQRSEWLNRVGEVEKIAFKRTPRQAADEIDFELREKKSPHWIMHGNLVPWQHPSVFERAAMEQDAEDEFVNNLKEGHL
jgi:hypothetical protein